MEKTNVKNTTTKSSVKEWTPNPKQNEFMETLKNYPDGATLKDIEIETGKTFATGCVNPLITKGLVIAEESADGYVCDIVYKGVVIGTTTKNWKKYKLA